jgi:hypothetical protein
MTDEEPALERAFVRSEKMVGRRIADEYVLVPIVGRGAQIDGIFNLNRVGAFIWERLDGRTGEAIVREVVASFEVEPERAAADYRSFIQRLQSIRAVHPA